MVKFGQLVVCAAAGCAVGLKDFIQLVSTGYGGAMVVQSLFGIAVHRKKVGEVVSLSPTTSINIRPPQHTSTNV